MSNEQIVSFTQKVLLHKTVLDFMCPPNCVKTQIKQIDDSIIETLKSTPKNIFAGKVNTSTIHWITKPLKAAVRASIIGSVVLTVSPVGTIYNAGMTVGHFLDYSFKKYVQGEALATYEWETIKSYAAASFADFSCLLSGSIIVIFTAVSWMITANMSLQLLETVDLISDFTVCFFSFGASAFGMGCLGAYYPSSYLARMLGNSDSRTGIYLALELRNQFGLVSDDGSLLKFCKQDEISYKIQTYGNQRYYTFDGEIIDVLQNLIYEAEIDVIELVKEANQWLKMNHLEEIPFAYPFNGDKVAKKLEVSIKEIHSKESKILKVVKDLKKMDHKIKAFHNFFYDAKWMPMAGSIQMEVFEVFSKRHKNINIKKVPAFVDEVTYQRYFEMGYGPFNLNQKKFNPQHFYTALNIKAQKPEQREPVDLYQKFLYRLKINKWKLDNTQDLMQPYEILGLNKNDSYLNTKKTMRNLQLALHPDKNRNRIDEANLLFQAFQTLKNEI